MEGHQQSDDARAGRARILDGRVVSAAIIRKVRSAIDAHVAAGGRRPGLAVVLVGDDPASAIYVNAKRRDCEKAGILAQDYDLPASTSQEDLLVLPSSREHPIADLHLPLALNAVGAALAARLLVLVHHKDRRLRRAAIDAMPLGAIEGSQ